MRPLRVRARNFRTYRQVDWGIPPGLTALIGNNTSGDGADSNGSGKSSLLELVQIALFGPALPWSEYLTSGIEETECRVELEFSHADETYKVIRTYDAKGAGKTTLDLQRWMRDDDSGDPRVVDPEYWNSITGNKQSETQATLEKLIGITESVFTHSVFAAQGARHFADPALTAKDRKAILTESLNLEIWDRLKKLCDADVTETKNEVAGIDQRIGAYQEDLAQTEELNATHVDLVNAAGEALTAMETGAANDATARATHERLRVGAAEHAAAAAGAAAAHGALAALRNAETEAEGARTQIAEIHARRTVIEPLAAKAAELIERVKKIQIADATREQAERERTQLLQSARAEDARVAEQTEQRRAYMLRIDQIQAQILAKRKDPGVCDHCKQPLTGEALEEAINSLRRDIDTLTAQAQTISETATATQTRARSLQAQADVIVIPEMVSEHRDEFVRAAQQAHQAESELLQLTERESLLQARVAQVSTEEWAERIRRAADAATSADRALNESPQVDPEALAAAIREATRTSTDLAVARSELSQADIAVATSAERIRNLAALAERSQEALAARAGLLGRLDVLTALSRSYGRDGIPALILEASAIPQIETEAQRVLQELGMPFRIELVTQRENKTGGGLKDTLDVVVHEPNGARMYQTFSGGERTRLELALRIALARLIAGRSGSHCDLLCLDEPTWLDRTGLAQLAGVLRGLSEFRSVILVSHDERLIDEFDQTVCVVRDENGSRVEEAA